MKAQVSVTPNEAKRLIAKGIVHLPEVQAALKNGKIVIKSGTTPSAVAEELIGQPMGVSGRVSPRGTMGAQDRTKGIYRVLIDRGKVTSYAPGVTQILSEADTAAQTDFFPQMGRDDVIITGANALDPQKRAGLWIGEQPCHPATFCRPFGFRG